MSSFDSLESVITVNWPSTHTELRDAIFHLLLNDRLYGIRCSADQLVTALNSLGGADGREDVLLVDERLIKDAFRGGDEFSVPYNNPIIDIDKGGKGWFNARVNMYVGSSRAGSRRAITDFGYFRSEFEGVLSYRSVGPDVHPLDNWQRYKNKIDIPVHVKQSLNLWLKQRKADKLRREKRNKKYKGPRGTSPKPRSVSPKPKPTESSKRQLSPSKSAKKDVPQSESSNLAGSPPHPASKKPRDTNTADLMEEYERKQAEMNQLEEQIQSRLVLEGISARSTGVAEDVDSSTVYYIYQSRAGKMDVRDKPNLLRKLKAGLIDLPDHLGNAKADETRSRTGYEVVLTGASMSWIPKTHELKIKNRAQKTKTAVDSVKSLHDLFDGKKTRFNKDALRIMAACNQFGYGCSDEANVMIMAGAIKALLHQMGITDISAQDIACGLPSRASLAKAEKELSADCLAKVCVEIFKDGAKHLCIITDHGHRKGQDHFVKLLVWAGKDAAGRNTLKFHCIDVDIGGHTADAAANAVKISLDTFMAILKSKLGEDVRISVITGDSGGGASVQRLHPALIQNGSMDANSIKLACHMHGLNKSLEIACIDSLGKQGIGHRTTWQMIYLFPLLLKNVRKQFGSKNLDNMWAMTIHKLMNDSVWQREASAKCKQPFEELMTKMRKLEVSDFDALVALTTGAPKNIQDPVLSRWGSVLDTCDIFVEYYVLIYFFAIAVKQFSKPTKNSSSPKYLYQVACSLISLMNNRSTPTSEGETIDEFIASFNDSPNEEASDEEHFLQPGDSPVFLTTLYFVNGFAKSYYNDMFNWMMQSHPHVGKDSGTFGQLAQWGPERCYVMHMKLRELEGGGFKRMKEFKRYVRALNGVGHDDEVGHDFFERMTAVFFERFRFTFEKHVANQWRSSETLHYILGGDKHHAHAFARWLVDYSGRTMGGDIADSYSFPDRQVTLARHHKMTHGNITVNLRDSMDYLTSEANREVIINTRFITRHWHEIEILGASETPVDLFGTGVPDALKPLRDAIWSQVSIHAIHQQRCENYVQLSGLISLTGVGEARRSCRALAISSIIRRFNHWGLAQRNKELMAEGKQAIKQLQGSPKTRLFLQFLDKFVEEADLARIELGDDVWKDVFNRLEKTDEKASRVERDEALNKFEKDLKQKRKEMAAELPTGIDKTARVGGGIILRILTKSNNFEPHVNAEIRARSIPMSVRQEASWTLAEKRGKIRQHEFNRKCTMDPDFTRENTVNDIRYIVPLSSELRSVEVLEKQQSILDREAGILALEEGN